MSFTDKLATLTSAELASADAERIGVMIERLANSLGMTIAVACNGNAKAMDEMLRGAESYLYEAASSHAPLGKLMASAKGRRP